MWGEHVAHDVPVDVDAERARDDARDPWAAEPRIARLELDDGADECLTRTLRTGLSRMRVRREEAAILATCQLTPYSRPLVSRIGGHPFSLEGGHPFSGDRGPVVFTRSGATRLRPMGGHLPVCHSPQSRVLLSPFGRGRSWREGERTCWRFVS